MIEFKIKRDAFGQPTYCPRFSEDIYNCILQAGVAKSVTVPTNAHIAIISASDYYFIAKDTTAVLPTTAELTQSSSMQVFSQIDITGVTTLSIVSRNTSDLSIAFYS